jgi:ribosomal protein S18 acetylase RimI-like enzyme
MLSYHAGKGHARKSASLSVWLKNEKDNVVGGAIVTFLWNGMEINSLWIDESMRNQGWGRKLLRCVEEEGRKRGCTISYTNTFTWQAPEFYEKLGYKLYGNLDNFPLGSSLNYYYKQL